VKRKDFYYLMIIGALGSAALWPRLHSGLSRMLAAIDGTTQLPQARKLAKRLSLGFRAITPYPAVKWAQKVFCLA